MTDTDDYCEMCDLPRSQCIHGRPPPPEPVKAAPATPKPRKRATTTRASSTTTPKKTVTRRWTPPEALKPMILTVLEQAGGQLEADDLFVALEAAAQDSLKTADLETTPEGELRWRFAARKARVALIDEGLMTKTTPGLWQLA